MSVLSHLRGFWSRTFSPQNESMSEYNRRWTLELQEQRADRVRRGDSVAGFEGFAELNALRVQHGEPELEIAIYTHSTWCIECGAIYGLCRHACADQPMEWFAHRGHVNQEKTES